MQEKSVEITVNETECLKKVERKTRKLNPREPLEEQEVKKIFNQTTNFEDKVLFVIGFNSGMRVSEIATIIQNNINKEDGIIKIWDEKKNVYRNVYVPEYVISTIQQWLSVSAQKKRVRDTLWTFESKKTIERRIQFWTEKILGKKRSWHAVRHTYITISILKNVPLRVICDNTGDTERVILKYYNKIPPQRKKEIVNANAITEG